MSTLLPTSDAYINEQNLRDVIGGKGITIDVEENSDLDDKDETIDCFEKEQIIKNMSYACEGDDSDDDVDDDSLPFERMAKKMKDISKDGGVLKQVLTAGTGKVVPEDSIVRVHYNFYLELAAEPYDSTRLRKKPHRFRLGSSDVLTGFDIGVASMRKGELSRFLLRPDYALGDAGCPPRVPPKSTVMMEIELLSFVVEGGVEDFFHLTNEERGKLTFDQIKKVCNSQREEGNVFVGDKQWGKAVTKYKKATNILELVNLKNSMEQHEQQKILLKLYLNMSLCSLKLASYSHVLMLCNKALEIDWRNVKAMYRKGKALRFKSQFERAREWLLKAQKQEPNNADIHQELQILAKDVKNFNMIERDMYKKMFTKTDSANTELSDTDARTKPEPKKETIDVSLDFQNTVSAKLKQFQDESDESDLPFPACNLTVPEIAFVMQAATDLNLDVIQRGEGYNLKLNVRKKPKD